MDQEKEKERDGRNNGRMNICHPAVIFEFLNQ